MNKREGAPGAVQLPMAQLSPLLLACLAEGQEVVLAVTGNSMAPFLRHGRDQVVLAACDGAVLGFGDVPLYRRDNGQYVLHRVVKRRQTAGSVRYTLLGDAQWEMEPEVTPEQVVACAVGFIRNGKRYSCTSPWYRARVRVWQWLLPVRRWLIAVYRRSWK
ncbi:MAG: S24/S26 family peptidase [Clostridia bacterium]|nr:S24/S26 family peptidase [Clostridia bacterium]